MEFEKAMYIAWTKAYWLVVRLCSIPTFITGFKKISYVGMI